MSILSEHKKHFRLLIAAYIFALGILTLPASAVCAGEFLVYSQESKCPDGTPSRKIMIASMSDDGVTTRGILSKEGYRYLSPTIAPSGKMVAYSRGSSGKALGIFLQRLDHLGNADGDVVPVTPMNATAIHPRFSGDSTMIAYSTDEVDSTNSADAADPTNPAGPANPAKPTAQNTRRIAIKNVKKAEEHGIALTSAPVQFIPSEFPAFEPTLNFDGSQLVYAVAGVGGRYHLVHVDLTTNTQTRLATRGVSATMPAFSRDGEIIAYTYKEGSNWHIALLDLATGESSPATSGPSQNQGPAWTADGSLIYTAALDGDFNIHLISASSLHDGTLASELLFDGEGRISYPSVGGNMEHAFP